MGKRMRLDLKAFQKQKAAGAIVIAVAVFASLIVVYLVESESSVAKYYLGQGPGKHVIPNAAVFDRIIEESKKPVAVMFESPTCPVCKAMYPYWAVLEKESSTLPIAFYHVVYSSDTLSLFQRYGVTETPTFIVFVKGRVVARHVGAFEASNVADAMLAWALAAAGSAVAPKTPKGYAEAGLKIWQARCAACHGPIKGLDKASIEEWLRNAGRYAVDSRSIAAVQMLKSKIEEAEKRGVYLHELYHGFDGLVDAVLGMRKYMPDLLYHEASRTAYLLDYITAVLEDKKPPVFAWMNLTSVGPAATSNSGQASRVVVNPAAATVAQGLSLVALVTALVAGVISVFSPCVLPLLVAQLSVVASTGERIGAGRCIGCGIAAAAGVIGVGALFLVAGGLVSSVQRVLLVVVSVAIIAAGAASLLGVPVELKGLVSGRRGGFAGFCAVYGFLAVQCNLPIVVGALLLVMGLGLSIGSVLALAALAAGIGVPLAVVMWLVSRGGAGIASKLMEKNEVLTRIGGAVLLAAGLYLLLYNLQLI